MCGHAFRGHGVCVCGSGFEVGMREAARLIAEFDERKHPFGVIHSEEYTNKQSAHRVFAVISRGLGF